MINRAEQQAAYVLHRRPFKETSFIVDVFTCNYGRLSFVANGAKKPGKSAILQPFQPLLVSWTGKSSLKTLTQFELSGVSNTLTGLPFYCGYYLNEILLYCLPEGEPHEWVFAEYISTLQNLSDGGDVYLTLRSFEFTLLRELGVLPNLSQDVRGQHLSSQYWYTLSPEQSLIPVDIGQVNGFPAELLLGVSEFIEGKTERLRSLHEHFKVPLLQLSRSLMAKLLDGRPLKSKDMLKQYQAYATPPN